MNSLTIPRERLDTATLRRLIEEYVSREGTDYGAKEYSLNEKISHVLKQLDCGEALIVFDTESQSCNIITREQLAASNRST